MMWLLWEHLGQVIWRCLGDPSHVPWARLLAQFINAAGRTRVTSRHNRFGRHGDRKTTANAFLLLVPFCVRFANILHLRGYIARGEHLSAEDAIDELSDLRYTRLRIGNREIQFSN